MGLAKGLALIAIAGGAGVLIGFGLSTLSGNDEAAKPVAVEDSTSTASADLSRTTTSTTTATTQTRTQTTTTPSQPGFEQVDVRVLGAVLRPAGEPSGVEPQDGDVVMRVRAENRGSRAVTIKPPVLRIGSVRTPLDPDGLTPESQFGSLAGGETKAVTLKFKLTGEATPKATRDRRARIEIAGGSQPLRLKIAAR